MRRATKGQLMERYQSVRAKTEELCRPLEIEDYVIQSIDDVSPPKWHLAHTTWFFETFVLIPKLATYRAFDPIFQHLFNSYYQTLGEPYPRLRRGVLARPTVKTIYSYRHYLDQALLAYIDQTTDEDFQVIEPMVTLGLHHEQQHQELILMDIKHNFSQGPDFPSYQAHVLAPCKTSASALNLNRLAGGIVEIGHQGNGFCFDNELPRNELILKPYLIATRLVTNGEYAEFIDAGGYQNPTYWLSDGWDCVLKNQWQAPLYWYFIEGSWYLFTLNGLCKLDENEPVSHVSFYEADAYARFRGLRLPLEAEWEHCVAHFAIEPKTGHFLEENVLHPKASPVNQDMPQQFFGDLWEWTRSPYCAYPGYKQHHGALGEYNGKFMSNQFVLRGGACVTPQSHIRATYRNFFQPEKRWQFSGIRLAADS